MEEVFSFLCSNTYRSHCDSRIAEGMRPSPSSDANPLGCILPFTVWTTSFSLKAAQGATLGPGWLSDTEKWNSMALIVKCCSSSEEEQPTWTLLTSGLLQLSFTGRMQANLPSVGFPLALLLGVCQHQPKVKGKSPFFLARGTLCFPPLPSRFSIKGKKTLPNYPFTLCFQNLAGWKNQDWAYQITFGLKTVLGLQNFPKS